MSYCKAYLAPITNEALGKAFGGRRITFPDLPQGKRWEKLVLAIGEDHAHACVKFLAGMTVSIPKQGAEIARNEAFRELHRAGWTPKQMSEIGFVTTYSVRHIQRVLKEQQKCETLSR